MSTAEDFNKLADAEDFLVVLDREVENADFAEAKNVGVDLDFAAETFIKSYDGMNRFVNQLKAKLTLGRQLTQSQLRAALNVKLEEMGKRKKANGLQCFVCMKFFPTWDELREHKEEEHDGPSAVPVLTETPGHNGSAEGVAVIENTTATKGLDLSSLPDARYALPNMSGVTKDQFIFLMVKRVRRTTRRDRRYVYGKIKTGDEIVLQGTIEVKLWSSDSKELVGEQKPGDVYRGKLEEELEMLMSAPEQFAKMFGKLLHHCCICGKPLTDDESRVIGMGLECEKKVSYFKDIPKSYRPDCPTCADKGVNRLGRLVKLSYDGKSATYQCLQEHVWRVDKDGKVTIP